MSGGKYGKGGLLTEGLFIWRYCSTDIFETVDVGEVEGVEVADAEEVETEDSEQLRVEGRKHGILTLNWMSSSTVWIPTASCDRTLLTTETDRTTAELTVVEEVEEAATLDAGTTTTDCTVGPAEETELFSLLLLKTKNPGQRNPYS